MVYTVNMQSLIIASKNKEDGEIHIQKICAENNINSIDVTFAESEKSLGIEEVRNLQKNIFLKPVRSPKKAVVLKNAETLTVEAQNALLKILEEPPPDTIIILSSLKKEAFLPTIISRCKIIEIKVKSKDKISDDYLNTLNSLKNYGAGEKLKLAQDLSKDKEIALDFLEKMILTLRIKMIEETQYSKTIRSFQETHTILQTTNTNPRLALENLFLNY